MTPHRRLPISARHAFALAFDLTVRRDALHSLIVPLMLRTPWILALALLPGVDEAGGRTALVLTLTSVALVGDYLVSLLVSGMLRYRARSVFNTNERVSPASAGECYAKSLVRVPWLAATELLRNMAMLFAGFFLVLPGVWVGFRLSMATEIVVLRGGTAFAAFQRSFHLMEDRFERWLEMIVGSVFIVLGVWFVAAFLYLVFPGPGVSTWASLGLFLLAAISPVIQYAWTFFYLRLEEIDLPVATEVPAAPIPMTPSPFLAPVAGTRPAAPHLTLVEAQRTPEGDDSGD